MKLLLLSLFTFTICSFATKNTFASIGSDNLSIVEEQTQPNYKKIRIQKEKLFKPKQRRKFKIAQVFKIDIEELVKILTMIGVILLFLITIPLWVLHPILGNILSAIILIVLLACVIKFIS